MVSECIAALPQALSPWRPCPPARERAAWQALPAATKARLTQEGKAAAQMPIAPLPLSLWLDFSRTGNRVHWENAYFSRRTRLAGLVCAECVAYDGAYMDAVVDTLWAICEESAWQLPAHNSYIRDTPQLPLPDVQRPVIDLFAAETGALLAVSRYLLGPELETAAPGLCARIDAALSRRILTPYLTSHFWWMGDGDEPMCNWTSWCTQNVLVTAFLVTDDPTTLRRVVTQAAYSLDCFLKDYGADGCCNEGAQYYRHAGLTLWGALDILRTAAPDAFAPLFRTEKIRNIAEYICNVHVEDKYYINFGDCSPIAGRCGAREYLFGKAVGSNTLMALAAADRRADADPDHLTAQDTSSAINLWYRLITAFTDAELAACTLVPSAANTVWYGSVGIYRTAAGPFTVSVKMGGNGDSHNHNDTGSVTVYKGGAPYLIDIGVESYTKKTFSPQRYEIWTMQSAWHNLPTFDGVMQKDGAAFRARDMRVEDGCISGELSGAYPPVEGLTRYRRTVRTAASAVTLTDETDWSGLTALTLMTEQPAVVEDSAACISVGTLGELRFSGGEVCAEVQAVPVTDPRLRTAWPETIYKITLHFRHTLTLELR